LKYCSNGATIALVVDCAGVGEGAVEVKHCKSRHMSSQSV
jgi:hypothetical protein